ncbi:MAG: M20/M25/M40 family metallo-hydrolase [Candidatus Faecousia sp.]|nr:M20/M25/M40 family metallo-hydrolase [Clostridiales bacterium]MDY6181792.1 M20/M25/M40 family metallo-hydrolase [Candidatus Faecousia sp.]
MFGIVIAALIVVFLAVITVRTLCFTPKPQPALSQEEVRFDRDAAVEALAQLVRCKTVSYNDHSQEDEGEFQKLISLLPKLFPNVMKTCEFRQLPDRALLLRWPGKTPGDPAVMMAHYDVVPVNEDAWDKPPFEAILEDGVLWGRGTLDTKVTFDGILSAANHLIAQGFRPEHDVYFAFSGGEEVNGLGAPNIVAWFREQGIHPALVVDEGGAVVENVFPGVKVPCGLIGIAEKGMMNAQFRTRSQGGHASAPKPHTPVGVLSAACKRVEDHPFKAHIQGPAAQMFDTLGRYSTPLYRVIFANLWCFGWLLDLLAKKSGGEMNALLRTTVAFTQMQGSSARNVIPPEATMVANMRLNPSDSVSSALDYLKKTVADDSVEITALESFEPSPVSETGCEAWEKVAASVAETWRGCVVAPYLMVQCSDSRHYGPISNHVYRFSAMDLTAQERSTIHGNNERIRVETAAKAVEFYIRLLGRC